MELRQPYTNKQEILNTLITKGHVSIFDYPYLSGYRTRVSELISDHGLNVDRKMDTRCNKFGNSYSYAIYILNPDRKKQAIDIYNSLFKE